MSEIRLFNQDCMKALAEMPDNYYSLSIVDPPYGINVGKMAYLKAKRPIKQRNGTKLFNAKTIYEPKEWDITPSPDYFKELLRVSKNQIIWGINYLPVLLNGGRIIWDKINGDTSFSDCEIAYCSLHKTVKLYRLMWSGMMQGSSINRLVAEGNKRLNEKRIHPTQKPIALYKWLLKNYAKPNDKILDTHLRSGSIAIACHDMAFDLDGYEIDKDYYDAAVKRLKLHQSQLSIPFGA